MLSIELNRAEYVSGIEIISHKMLVCNHKIFINIMLYLLNSTEHIMYVEIYTRPPNL